MHSKSATNATKVIEQKGMARSVSQYGSKKNKKDKKDIVLDIDPCTRSLLQSQEKVLLKKHKTNK